MLMDHHILFKPLKSFPLKSSSRPSIIPPITSIIPLGRFYSSPSTSSEPPVHVPVSLISQLRKSRPVPLSLAREALAKSSLDLQRALEYLDSSSSSSAKADKLSSRPTSQGTVAVRLLGSKRASMIHLGCETDFVAATRTFQELASGIAGTAAFLDVPIISHLDSIQIPSSSNSSIPSIKSISSNKSSTISSETTRTKGITVDKPTHPEEILSFPTEALLSAPMITLPENDEQISLPDPQTVQQRLLSSLGETGENLKLLRAVSYAAPFPSDPNIRYVPGVYSHQGKVASLVVLSVISADPEKPIASLVHGPGGPELENGLNELARGVARQTVGFPTRRIEKGEVENEEGEVLLDQDGMMLSISAGGEGGSVRDILDRWGNERGVKVKVVGMKRWSISDVLEGS
ncbi:hypothetical protein M231_06606 [Tremella mesenterica]|uniref:EF-TsMt n=1 Tax=Tremella mesenterica TaxID=5217 RepID=A0A4Q1BF11_TREME|nr:hypothetical protein M231_06606 [Tremella mesenterica]